MCDRDMYFYLFVMPDHQNEANMNSERPATLDAIKRKLDQPLMDSKTVVDRTEAVANGYVDATVDG